MILHYSSNNFSYKLGDSGAYIRKCPKGFYVDADTSNFYFCDFIFTSVKNIYYLIAKSNTEFVVYEITDKVIKALVIRNTKEGGTKDAFEHVVLSLNGVLVKLTPVLDFTNMDNSALSAPQRYIESREQFELYDCDLSFECNLPILYSLKAYEYHPYDGNTLTEFLFKA